MRVAVGKTLRVGPGDEVHLVARLRPEASLGRLFVFAKEGQNETFSPYTPMVDILVNGQPPILTPLMLRLNTQQPMRELQFVADFDGYVRIFQEVDTAKDVLARVRLQRTICAQLGWRDWLVRSLPWRPTSA
jgi:hypothetical protein